MQGFKGYPAKAQSAAVGFSLQMHSLLTPEMWAPTSCLQQECSAWPNEPSPLKGNCSEAMEGTTRSDYNHLHGH